MFSGPFSHLKVGVWRCNVGRPIMFKVNFVDFCHDSAKQASLMALAAPKVQCSKIKRWRPKAHLLRTSVEASAAGAATTVVVATSVLTSSVLATIRVIRAIRVRTITATIFVFNVLKILKN